MKIKKSSFYHFSKPFSYSSHRSRGKKSPDSSSSSSSSANNSTNSAPNNSNDESKGKFFKRNAGNESIEKSIFKSVFIAYFILVFHVLLLAGVGILIFFFRGIIIYWRWIVFGFIGLAFLTLFTFYRFLKKKTNSLTEILSLPAFQGRSIEVSLLGGLASLKMSKPDETPRPALESPEVFRLLEDPNKIRIGELTELAGLLDRNLITQEEYDQAKQQIFNSKLQSMS